MPEEQVKEAARQRPSEHGAILGAELARVADAMAPLHPEIPDRCRTCAFREGTVPNRCAGTLLQAMHCTLGSDPAAFGCHQALGADGLPTHLCAGYVLARKAPFDALKAALGRVLDGLGIPRTAKP